MRNTLFALSVALAAPWAQAHPGHGLDEPHWHATDALGFLIAGVVAAGLAWWMRRK
jgi:drug/metabolite transporter (DMT)-like permease